MDDDAYEEYTFMFDHVDVRTQKYTYIRIDWEKHLVACRRKPNGFQKQYHMEETSFYHLVGILDIKVHEGLSRASTNGNEPIRPHIVVACGLRYLGGEHCKSLVDVFGMSETSVQASVDKFIEAVLNCKEMDLKLPVTSDELQQSTKDFLAKSDVGELFYGCVGCIDGWLCCIQLPKDATNQADFYSGH